MNRVSVEQLHRALGGEICSGRTGPQVRCPGPGHSHADRSLAVAPAENADGFVVYSFAGDDAIAAKDFVREKLGLPPFRPHNGKDHSARPQRAITKVYDYTDESGELLFQAVRYEPKGFAQRRPNAGDWIWNLEGVRRVPYRLPEMIEALSNGNPIFVVEGEKDADALWALRIPATCNPQGAGKWRDEYSEHFRDAKVYVIPDNDGPGRDHAQRVVDSLRRVGATVCAIELPGLPDKGDVSDWLKAGGTAERLHELAEQPNGDGSKFKWIDTSRWDSEPCPQREWAVKDRIPLRQVTLLSGEGSIGKSIIELMCAVAHVTGKDWLGSLPKPGGAFYIGCEDDESELRIRLTSIISHYGTTFDELGTNGFRFVSLAGKDAVLGAPDRNNIVKPTALFDDIYEQAGDLKPKHIGIDTSADVFAGNESDRAQVRQFIGLLRRLAIVSSGSVVLLSHPSLQGISTGTGISGSTAWHNSVRARMYITAPRLEPGEQPDTDLRELQFKKSNYGPISDSIVLRYQSGLFLPEAGISNLDKLSREAAADEALLTGLRTIVQQGRDAMAGRTSADYGPTLIAELPDVKARGIRKRDLQQAMERLLAADKIHIGLTDGPPSKAKKRINVGAKQ